MAHTRRTNVTHSEVMMLPNEPVSVMITSIIRPKYDIIPDASDCRVNLTMSFSKMRTCGAGTNKSQVST